MDNTYGQSRFAADGNGETTCVVFAQSYEVCRKNLESFGVRVLHKFPFIGAYGITVNVHKEDELKNVEGVKAITKQSKVYTLLDKAKGLIVPRLEVEESGLTGKGVTVAVLDTGVAPHLDFLLAKNRIKEFVDFVGMSNQSFDDNGHGTFVAGAVCGSGLTANQKYAGIAPKAELVVLKCMDAKGEAGAFKILEAMQWVFDNHKKYNIKVACMSFGSEPLAQKDPLAIGADALWKIGITVVAAAGNSGPNPSTIKSPGICPSIITVGAVDFDLNVAPFSSRGPVANNLPKPDIVAPAVDITGVSNLGGYTIMSGTSIAAPMVAGLCALVLEKNPNWTNDKVKYELLRTAKKLNQGYNDVGMGLASGDILLSGQ